LVNSHVKDGGVLSSRGSSLRLQSTIVKADVGGDASQIAVNVFGASVAQFRGATIEGTVLLNSNAVLEVLDSFLAIPFGPTVINSSSPTPIICQNFSSITQPPNTLVDASLVPLTEDDVSIAEIARNVPGCTLSGF